MRRRNKPRLDGKYTGKEKSEPLVGVSQTNPGCRHNDEVVFSKHRLRQFRKSPGRVSEGQAAVDLTMKVLNTDTTKPRKR